MNITERNYNVSTLNNRIENEGATAQGRLSAAQFNTLVNAAIEAQDNIGLLDAAIPKDLGTRLQNAETKFTHKINASSIHFFIFV